MNPCCPFIKKYAASAEENQDEENDILSSNEIPNVPVRYHFFYQILDGDDKGQSPYTEDNLPNENFNYSAKSCLELLAENSTKEVCVLVFLKVILI